MAYILRNLTGAREFRFIYDDAWYHAGSEKPLPISISSDQSVV